MRILIAEDDLTTRTILKTILTRWGFQVESVDNGTEALEVMKRPDAPKLALLDWMMPGMDGLEVCWEIRALGRTPPPYLLMVSARRQPGDIVSGLRAGANDYLTKPYDNEELQTRLELGKSMVALQERLLQREDELKAAGLRIKELHGLFPICQDCRKPLVDLAVLEPFKAYAAAHPYIVLGRARCPECQAKLSPESVSGVDPGAKR